ncbi:thioredoxin family protein [Tenacibaculum sp. M341]|uniref:thioredoxin family protein n=1 Tax=Tenacibaculum sp. M341 TaxID=2530339 RepID=UPI0010436E69|nr:thioredoxin family protein [Tenacibaculum sp. M341]TCI84952.1 thioredoxin family protein [Tenacibaculum sp. M341]
MNVKTFILLFICVSLNLFSQQEKVQVLHEYTFEELTELQKKEQRPVVVFLHTNWCKYCFAMKKNTFTNTKVIDLLNNNFYFISFNAESKKEITYNNYTFKFKPSGTNTGVHELAIALTSNKLTYPSTIVLSNKNEIIFEASSFLNYSSLIKSLKAVKN